jgi:hypothetical protein
MVANVLDDEHGISRHGDGEEHDLVSCTTLHELASGHIQGVVAGTATAAANQSWQAQAQREEQQMATTTRQGKYLGLADGYYCLSVRVKNCD